MKIISLGSINPPPQYWWTLKAAKCDNCGTVIQLQEADIKSIIIVHKQLEEKYVICDCPMCKNNITVSKD
jgi:hypothetical protein